MLISITHLEESLAISIKIQTFTRIFDLAIQLGVYLVDILEYVQNNICQGNFKNSKMYIKFTITTIFK